MLVARPYGDPARFPPPPRLLAGSPESAGRASGRAWRRDPRGSSAAAEPYRLFPGSQSGSSPRLASRARMNSRSLSRLR